MAQVWLPDVNDGLLRMGTWAPIAPEAIKKVAEEYTNKIKSGEITAENIFALTSLSQDTFYKQTEIRPQAK